MPFELTPRERRWFDALIILATVALGFVVLGYAAIVLEAFGDLILVFFLAWLLAFILSPLVSRLVTTVPFLTRAGAVVIVYAILFGGLVLVTVVVAGALAGSITDFIANVPTLRTDLPKILEPWQARLDGLGLGQVDLVAQAGIFLDNLNRYAGQLAGPLQSVAVASLGAIANLLLILILSLYMVADRDRMLSFLFRIVPPAYKEEAQLLETSVARSFGGFLRGQAIMGVTYALVAILASSLVDLQYLSVIAASSGLLMAVPFFGPFVAWAPPVLVALVTHPEALLPVTIIMVVGWLLVMNALQPRLMADALRIHPIVVLGSVLVGSKVAGVGGAIFGIPIAAVLAAFFFHYLGRSSDAGPVAVRAARRLETRDGRPIRIPREPEPGIDSDVEG